MKTAAKHQYTATRRMIRRMQVRLSSQPKLLMSSIYHPLLRHPPCGDGFKGPSKVRRWRRRGWTFSTITLFVFVNSASMRLWREREREAVRERQGPGRPTTLNPGSLIQKSVEQEPVFAGSDGFASRACDALGQASIAGGGASGVFGAPGPISGPCGALGVLRHLANWRPSWTFENSGP